MRSQAESALTNTAPDPSVHPFELSLQLAAQTTRAEPIRGELKPEAFGQTWLLEAEASELIDKLLPAHREAPLNLALEHIDKTGSLSLDGLPNMIAYPTPSLMLPAESLAPASRITFYFQDVSEFGDLSHHLKTLPAFDGSQLNQQTLALLFRLQRVATDDVLLQNSNHEVETGSHQNEAPQLEVAPGGGNYWIEDPNAAWW